MSDQCTDTQRSCRERIDAERHSVRRHEGWGQLLVCAWWPLDTASCIPRWKVAIIIPFRDRFVHLPIILRHLVPFLKEQYLEFGIFFVEQANELEFNRAMLMNVGYIEALNYTQWDCFIFHDVDHIPLSHGNFYGCSGMPKHFLSGADRWGYKLLYSFFSGQ
ncbi:hypothetical protein BSL78_13686 [Apostichopus japonicus]|uniref:Galactosyltransferase N-terminal domain-containing protein n=1 Tax=Stichopus japonicus TaxID=307972 RepID=A0A2G8KN40_STIJA|nr:hypothetical protein BSL78_13686 [Apostichopus japonicus]